MALSQMQVFNEYYMPAVYETLAQRIELFNAASAGAIVLSTQGFDGDFMQKSFFDSLFSNHRSVDRYAANNAVAPVNLAQKKETAVKVAGGFGPVAFEPSQMTWLQKPTAEAIEVISAQMADALLQVQVNNAIAALVAALEAQADARNDVSAVASPGGALAYTAINGAHAKFGDMSGNLVVDVMNGQSYHRLIQGNFAANMTPVFAQRGLTVVNLLNKVGIVTDAPALYAAGTPNKLKVLSLAEGAATIMDNGDIIANIQTNNGKERIETTFQADYTYGLALKGYTWDETNGGKSPTTAEIATGANWDRTAASVKNSAGVITVVDAAQ
jgi:hypothetical protein